MPHLVWTTTADGKIDYVNRRWREYLGTDPSGLTTRESDYPHEQIAVHPDDAPAMWAAWENALQTGQPYTVEYRLRRKSDGTYRWFLALAVPVRDAGGTILRWIGTCTDIEDQRRIADNLRFASEAAPVLSSTFDPKQISRRLAQLAVQQFADWCVVEILREDGTVSTEAMAASDDRELEALAEYRRRFPVSRRHPIMEAIRNRTSRLLQGVSEDLYRQYGFSEDQVRSLHALPMRSAMIVPLVAGEQTFGAVSIVSTRTQRIFTDDDLQTAKLVVNHAAVALKNALSYEHERNVASTLQRALLPSKLPEIPTWTLDATYATGSSEADVGGDWYDAFCLPDGRAIISVGDVAGQGIRAAVIMGLVRQTIEINAMSLADPAWILDATETALARHYPDTIVTAFVAVLDDRNQTLRYANAGHPPPLLRLQDGQVEELRAQGLPLGARDMGERGETCERRLDDVSAMVFYTDGLIETTYDMDEGLAAFRLHIETSELSQVSDAAALVAHGRARGEHEDDIAVLTLVRKPYGFSASPSARFSE